MKISQKGKDFLKQMEGFKGCPYLDSVKMPTIGIGSTIYPNGIKVAMTDPCIDISKAFEYLEYHVNKRIIKQVADSIRAPLNQNQTDAVISFIYNVGAGRFKASTLLRRINVNPNDVDGITAAFMMWVNAGGKPILTERRKQEVKLYFS